MFSKHNSDAPREYWLDVKDVDGYEVSNYGRIRIKNNGRIVKPYINRGYERVNMGNKRNYVHRVVADAFFDHNGGEHTQVNHIDGNKTNNNLTNLEWCTPQENIQHAFRTGLKYPSRATIVRCKFCIHRGEFDICKGKADSFYCAYGKR